MTTTARRFGLFLICAIGVLALPASAPAAQPVPYGVPGNWQLLLNEEFTGNGLNTDLWTPGWQQSGVSGPMNLTCLSSSNVSQPGNGYLYLQLNHQANSCEWHGEHVSGENTGGLVESNPADGVRGHVGYRFFYGYVEWRVWIPGVAPSGVECPRSGCLPDFPALWSLPESHASEIDTMEGLGTKGQACFHLPPPFGSGAPGACTTSGYAGSWHTFGAEWEPNGTVAYYYDGTKVGELSSSRIAEPQYLVMDIINPVDGQPLVVPDTMTVDYVRVWQHEFPQTTSSWVGREQVTANTSVYCLNGSRQVSLWSWTTGTGWVASLIGGEAEEGTVPTIMRDPGTGDTNVYYINSAGQVAEWAWAATTGWVGSVLGGNVAPGTTLSATREETTGNTDVYYVDGSHELAQWYWTAATGWRNAAIGGQVASGTGPSAVRDPSTGNTDVYYVNSAHELAQWYWTEATSWVNATIGGRLATSASTSPVRDPSGATSVYYVNELNELARWDWTSATGWKDEYLGGQVATGSSPTAAQDVSTGNTNVYYVNRADELAQWYWTESTGWGNAVLGGHVAEAFSPSAVRDPITGSTDVFYTNSSNEMAQWYWTSSTGWVNERL